MVTRLHIDPSSTDTEATLPPSLLDRLGIRDGGDVEFVVRDNCVVLRVRDEKGDLQAIADEIMDQHDAVFRALS